jgi:FAD:protein FMN transferase
MIVMRNDKIDPVVEKFRALGTDVEVEIVAVDDAEKEKALQVIGKVKEIFTKNEKIFSRFLEDSELSRLNKNIGKKKHVSAEMKDVLKLCLKFYAISDGFFDPRIIGTLERIGYDRDFKKLCLEEDLLPEKKFEKIEGRLENDLVIDDKENQVLLQKRMDTTGIAKGYTVDEAAEYLRAEGFENFIVDAGGDMFARGCDVTGEPWKIDIEGAEAKKILLKLENEGIATSGISRKRWARGEKKFHHLINPKDPENFSFDIKTVTVIDVKTVEADGRAKVLVLLGRDKGLEFAKKNNLKAAFLDYRGNIYLSEAMKNSIVK